MMEKKQYLNNSGIRPSGNRIIVKPDDLEEVTEGGIVIPGTVNEQHQDAQSIGTLVEAGPDSWVDITEKVYRPIDGSMRLVEVRKRGYSHAFADPGDRVAFAKYGGLKVIGEDGVEYRILNDLDITARVTDRVSFTDIQSRRRVSA